MYEIEKNIPFPERKMYKGRAEKYPFKTMEIGDSFIVECIPEEKQKTSNRVVGAAIWVARQQGKKFRTRQVDGGVRCWRFE